MQSLNVCSETVHTCIFMYIIKPIGYYLTGVIYEIYLLFTVTVIFLKASIKRKNKYYDGV